MTRERRRAAERAEVFQIRPSGVRGADRGTPELRRTKIKHTRQRPVLLRSLAGACCLGLCSPANLAHAGVAKSHSEAELDAGYAATLLGIPIGHIHWTIELQDNRFSAAASGQTAGLLSIFARGHGTAEAHGSVAGKQPAPANFAVSYSHDSASEEIKIAFNRGKAREHVAPPLKPNPSLVPLTDANRAGVVDPMTALLIHVPGSGDVTGPGACEHKIAVFDGRMRYDMGLSFKRMEQVKADTGYQGPAVVCKISFTPLAGYDPNRYAIKYLQTDTGMELWLAPLAGTRLMVPFRVSVPTPIGVGILQATRFVWTRPTGRSDAVNKD
jgi:Protein of unknown function (DUF3108)